MVRFCDDAIAIARPRFSRPCVKKTRRSWPTRGSHTNFGRCRLLCTFFCVFAGVGQSMALRAKSERQRKDAPGDCTDSHTNYITRAKRLFADCKESRGQACRRAKHVGGIDGIVGDRHDDTKRARCKMEPCKSPPSTPTFPAPTGSAVRNGHLPRHRFWPRMSYSFLREHEFFVANDRGR